MKSQIDMTLHAAPDSLLYPDGATQFTAVVLYQIDDTTTQDFGHALVFVSAMDSDHAAEMAEDSLSEHLLAHGYDPSSCLTTTILLFDGHQEAVWDANFDLVEEPPEDDHPDEGFHGGGGGGVDEDEDEH